MNKAVAVVIAFCVFLISFPVTSFLIAKIFSVTNISLAGYQAKIGIGALILAALFISSFIAYKTWVLILNSKRKNPNRTASKNELAAFLILLIILAFLWLGGIFFLASGSQIGGPSLR